MLPPVLHVENTLSLTKAARNIMLALIRLPMLDLRQLGRIADKQQRGCDPDCRAYMARETQVSLCFSEPLLLPAKVQAKRRCMKPDMIHAYGYGILCPTYRTFCVAHTPGRPRQP